MKTKSAVSKFLKEYRREVGLSQEEMAERIDVSGRHYIDLEHGKVETSFLVMVKIRKACGLDLNELADLIIWEEETLME